MMFIKKTAKEVEAENKEIERKKRARDAKKLQETTPARRAEKLLRGSERLLKKIAREDGPLEKAKAFVSKIEENHKIFFDCENELAKPCTTHISVAKSEAVGELLKKLPKCFPSEQDAMMFVEKFLTFNDASLADTKEHDKRSHIGKKRTQALDAITVAAEQVGMLAGLAGDHVKQVLAYGEED
ncbi:MAG: hypothetical protein WCP12_09540 [bacterium]